MNTNLSRVVVFDTETTGLRFGVDNIIEIAAVEIIGLRITGNQFHCFFPARKSIDKTALECHKMDNSFYSDVCAGYYKEVKEALANFVCFVGKSPVFGHNVKFDMKHLNFDFQFFGLDSLPEDQFHCTMKLFYDKLSLSNPKIKLNVRLEDCCEFFNITSKMADYHSAIFDALMTAKLLINLLEFDDPKNIFRNKEVHEKLLLSEEKYFAIMESRRADEFLKKKRLRQAVDETIEKQLGISEERESREEIKFQSSLDVNELFEGMEEKEVCKYIGAATDDEIDSELLDMIEQDAEEKEKQEVGKYREALKTYVNEIKLSR